MSHQKYQPIRDDDLRVIESEGNYVRRLSVTVLKSWPEEVLREWLFRHANSIEKYTFLNYKRFRFNKCIWNLDKIPGKEVFDDEGFYKDFQDIIKRAKNPHDWLAHYMLKEGTWNTPIIILDNNSGRHRFPNGKEMKTPISSIRRA